MRRALLGILAVGFLLGGTIGLVIYGTGDSSASAASSVALRVGLLLGALWLALPQVQQILRRWPAWLLGSMGVCLLALVVRPQLLVILIPLIGLLAVLQFVRWLFQPLPKPAKAPRSAKPSAPQGRPTEKSASRRTDDRPA